MRLVYLHTGVFVVWMLVFEKSPWPTLTLIVSLEAIFLSTFVMIGQNRQASFQQAKADHDFVASELELHRVDQAGPSTHHRDPRKPRPNRQRRAPDRCRDCRPLKTT